ncbi:MFS transporter [Varunaivibrio sulfuroxidans]|uniref:Sugar phosphate permease n=1 Tax=Varunaivibrio sulfuroxidans TaxID=1773489 RepID=A0A4V2UPA2_9PROT|nr:MFS transporter [Varunaivibrio sulfuroxidans]TCS65081.1 sugar phosphate permease [Varunaivibrio sulfuroxidans]WES29632.1 MFS transporter [Varunaivibrio sulfuroxidans]
MTAPNVSPQQSSPGVLVVLRVFLPFAMGFYLSYLYRVVNAVIAPELITDMGLDANALGLMTSAYFLAFAMIQIPVGVFLDRYGPRRTEAALLCFAALGAVIFALAPDTAFLVAGRALIGLGVSACLMAAFTASVMWFAKERLALVNGALLMFGGLGALSATRPVEFALNFFDWRGVFLVLAALTLGVAGLIIAVVPERKHAHHGARLIEQIRGVGHILTDRAFWAIAPACIVAQATFLAVQSLWAGPWLRDVAGLDRAQSANVLFLSAAAMTAGFLLSGVIAERLGRFGVRPMSVALGGMALFMVVQIGIIAGVTTWAAPLWAAFAFLGTTGTLAYAALSQNFPAHLAGRVNASLNVFVFILAFAAQWGIGAIINLWPRLADGGYDPAGYRAAFITMFALQALTATLYLAMRLRGSRARNFR